MFFIGPSPVKQMIKIYFGKKQHLQKFLMHKKKRTPSIYSATDIFYLHPFELIKEAWCR
ncbi:hypothetical protein CALK_0448 [Chitinivibrio alkaliphilus ACht1]|uniref:Uncharacterized protein n=1 Tax=Chitinivibrio alkaliphilus ACht1 TaxID=1313304 RepID=U7D993_9BACT|nr:hypothetical protein CALK_0448 [Chitinivibrio alkaliphilus ACht1]